VLQKFWQTEWLLYEKVEFDGINNVIIVHPDVTVLDIRTDVYSAWVRWVQRAPNFLPAMRASGADIIPNGETGLTFFMTNGWKLIYNPSVVAVSGVLYSDNYDTPYWSAEGNPIYPATVSALVNSAVTTQNVVTGTALTASEMWSHVVEGFTAEEMMRVMLAALAGKRQGLGTITEEYMAQDGTTPRITLTPDVNGNGTPTINGAI
tara:strand:- start:14467 stop:15084 length:618 start_codon:yes stop_codon:yes gene_type:complete